MAHGVAVKMAIEPIRISIVIPNARFGLARKVRKMVRRQEVTRSPNVGVTIMMGVVESCAVAI